MFKIESYVTPLILSYVEKYIKNLKPEDSEVSLWGGEAVFHNLDLRLDVLEAELQLPFTFTSGHIHELKILVPWTKLASEPIIVTINTIECTFKLRGDDTSDTSSQSSYRSKKTRKQSKTDNPLAPGYVQSLAQRMVSNINIICNNVILKYLEDDIVLSLNARTFSWSSANPQWEPAFTELTLPQLILRKIMNVSDITVCLDQRSPSGKILCYQEPLLYRCTLQMRVCLFYANLNAPQASAIRLHLFCSQLHFSVSDVQLPMCSRLIELAWGLYKGDLGTPKHETKAPEEADLLEEESEAGWIGWAWGKVPSILPVYWEEEDINQIVIPKIPVGGKVLEFGFYIDRATFTFKVTEKVGSGFNHAPKYRFHPFLVVSLQGMFVNGKIGGLEWVCVKGGVSHLRVETQGSCPCGQIGVLPSQLCLLQGLEGQIYKTGTLFDEESGELVMSYGFNWDQHVATLTESAMLEVTAALGFDYLYEIDLPEDFGTEHLSQLGSELEYSNLSERALMRCVVGPLQLRLHASFLHRLNAIMRVIHHHYPAYPVRERLSRRSKDDSQHLFIPPTRTYQMAVLRPVVFVSSLFHGLESSSESVIQFGCTCVDVQYMVPMYPKRASEENHIPSSYAYSTIGIKAQDVRADWVEQEGRSTWLEPMNFSCSAKHLLCPALWPNLGQILWEFRFHFDDVKGYLNPPQFILLQNVPSLINATAEDDTLRAAWQDAVHMNPRLKGHFHDVTLAFSHTCSGDLYQLKTRTASISSSKLVFQGPDYSTEELLPIFPSDTDYFLDLSFFSSATHASAVHGKLKRFSLVYDEDIKHFLLYVPQLRTSTISAIQTEQSTSPTSAQNDSCQSILDSSLDYRTLVTKKPETPPSPHAQCLSWQERLVQLENVYVYFDFQAGTVSFPFETEKQALVLVLPQISFTSLHKVDLEVMDCQLPLSEVTSHSPYALRMSQLSCYTKSLANLQKHVLLSPMLLECTLAWSPLERSPEEDKDFGLGIHIDMNPVQVSLRPEQTDLLVRVYETVSNLWNELPANSKASGDLNTDPGRVSTKARENFSIFLQWTLPRFLFAVHSGTDSSKLVLDVEDIVTSIDLQPVYAKLKSKLTHLSVKHYNWLEKGWRLDERTLGVVLSSSDDVTRDLQLFCIENSAEVVEETTASTAVNFKSSGAVSLTITRAWNVNVQQKLVSSSQLAGNSNATVSPPSEGRFLNEVDVNIEPLDVIVTSHVLQLLLDAFQPLHHLNSSSNTKQDANEATEWSNANLPLVFLNAKPLRVFMLSNSTTGPDFLLVEVDRINLVPHNENPISRPNILRSDLFENALETGVLFTPGSDIEDRQFCCGLRNLTVSTGTWAQVRASTQLLHHKKAHLRTMSENPALEWNAVETGSLSDLSVAIAPLTTKVNVNCVYAPSIMHKSIRVAGVTYEIHVTSPANVFLCPNQWQLLQSLQADYSPLSKPSQDFEPRSETDSSPGVPTHTLVTANKISVLTYEEKGDKYAPLVHAWVFQPHVIWDNRQLERRFEVDVFDISLRSSTQQAEYESLNDWNKELHKYYDLSWLETKPGERNAKTGIPPSAFYLNIASNDRGSLKLNFGRPLRFSFDILRYEQVILWASMFPLVTSPAVAKQEISNISRQASLGALEPKSNVFSEADAITEKQSVRRDFGACEIHSTQVVLIWPKEGQDLTLSVAKLECVVKCQDLDAAEGIFVADSLMASVNHTGKVLLCLDPVSLRFEGHVTWPIWSLEPHIQMAAQCDRLRFHMEPRHILAYEALRASFARLQRLNTWKATEIAHKEARNLSPSAFHAQSYQDDLRTGAFQFVLPSGDRKSSSNDPHSHPLPYQVMFSDYPPAMTWCYPHPRTLILIHIAPIPFVVPASCSSKPEKVVCHLQYWDHWRFETLVTFQLSESSSYRCRVPAACASLWRVIMHFEDEDTIAITPPALAAALRVDSRFEPGLIPRFQLWLQLAQLEIQLHNTMEREKLELPVELKAKPGRFSWDETTPTKHSFATLGWQKCDLILRAAEDSLGAKLSCGIGIKVLDYSTLEECSILESRSLQAEVNLKDQGRKLQVTVSGDKLLEMRFSQTVYHTLNQSNQLWMAALNDRKFQNGLVHYVIVNDTGSNLRLGQVDTGESVMLKPDQVHPYAWRSSIKAKELQVCSENGKWKWSDPFRIDQCGTTAKSIKNHPTASKVLIQTKSLNSIQNMVVLRGCVQFLSNLRETLEIRVIPTVSVATQSSDILGDMRVTVSPETGVVSTLASVRRIQGFRIRIPGHAWSVPLSASIDESLNLWAHLIRQEGKEYSRLLLFLTPLYMVQSFLPQPIRLHIRTPGKSGGLCQQLTGKAIMDTLAASSSLEQSHQLTLQLSPDLPESSPPVALAWNTANQLLAQNATLGIELGIDDVIEQISQVEDSWPMAKEKQGFIEAQPKTDVQVSFRVLSPRCQTVCVQVKPWALMINQTDLHVFLKPSSPTHQEAFVCSLEPNAVMAPPPLKSTFQIGVCVEDELVFSPPLQLEIEAPSHAFRPKLTGTIPLEGHSLIPIWFRSKVYTLVVVSEVKNSIRWLRVHPAVHFFNRIGPGIKVRCSLKENLTSDDVELICEEDELPLQSFTATLYEEWAELPFALSFATPCGHFSPPLALTDTLSKRTLILPLCPNHTATPQAIKTPMEQDIDIDSGLGTSNASHNDPETVESMANPETNAKHPVRALPVTVTWQKTQGQWFVIMEKEENPPLVVDNCTEYRLLVGQASDTEPGQIVGPVTCIEPYSVAFQSVDTFDQIFPELLPQPPIRLLLSAMDPPIWSGALHPVLDYNQLMAIPNAGEMEIVFSHTGRVNQRLVTIRPANRLQIAAKDIRQRIGESVASPLSASSIASKRREMEKHTPNMDSALTYPKRSQTCGTFHLQASQVWPESDAGHKKSQSLEISANLKEISILFVDKRMANVGGKEILHLAARDVCVLASMAEGMDLHATLRNLRLENQLFYDSELSFDFPVILLPQDESQSLKVALRVGQVGIENVEVKIPPLSLFLEDVFWYQLQDYLSSFPFTRGSTELEKKSIPGEVWNHHLSYKYPLQLEELKIEPLSLHLSLRSHSKLYIALDHSPLSFGALVRDRIHSTAYKLGQSLALHYLAGALFKAGWVLGSLELLGSPTVLARTVGSGIRDLILLPYQGIFKGPRGFVAGILNGSTSLLAHVSGGTLVSMTQFASSLARNFDRLSCDSDYQTRTEQMRRVRPQGLGEGLTQGFTAFGMSILGGIGGLAHHPLAAVMEDGYSTVGMAKGVAKGLVGVVTKPVGGAADLVAHTGQGLLSRTRFSQVTHPSQALKHSSSINRLVDLTLSSPSLAWWTWKGGVEYGNLSGVPADNSSHCSSLVSCVSATRMDSRGKYQPVNLALTPQVLCVLNGDTGDCEMLLEVEDVQLWPDADDNGLLHIRPKNKTTSTHAIERKEEDPPTSYDPNRIAEFVRQVTNYWSASPDLPSSTTEFDTTIQPQSQQAIVSFSLLPDLRSSFVADFLICHRHRNHWGFPVLPLKK